MNKYEEAEVKLVELLGGKFVHHYSTHLAAFADDKATLHKVYVPWTQHNSAAFKLMVEHGMVMNLLPSLDYVIAGAGGHMVTENIADHKNKEQAVRYAIVRAVIAKLESKNEDQNK